MSRECLRKVHFLAILVILDYSSIAPDMAATLKFIKYIKMKVKLDIFRTHIIDFNGD